MPEVNTSFTEVLELQAIGHFLHCKSGLEEQEADAFHELECIDLVVEKSLFSPHASHQNILVFKQQWEGPQDDMDSSLQQLLLCVVSDHFLVSSDVMHNRDGLQ